MKNLLVAINAKYSHSSLAIRYIKKYHENKPYAPDLVEYTINQHEDDIIRDLMTYPVDVMAFSCYIWNYEMILRICRDLKTIRPDLKILLGGPEVSYDAGQILRDHAYIDVVMYGEGERTYGQVCLALMGQIQWAAVKGIAYRSDQVQVNLPQEKIEDLDEIPFPYDDFIGLEHRKLYYESSRGCPYQCQYCLSSTTGRVRYFSVDRVKSDLQVFIDHKVPQVKFVDRTFNADPKRALDIMTFIHERDNGVTNFHFEIVASLLTEETMVFLEGCRPGLFQFEIGVQTTHPETMTAIKRNIDFDKLADKVKRLSSFNNIHLHLDLIAGLPYEDYDTFLRSFEDVYKLKPEMLQLGFLKLLKGSGLRLNQDQYGYVYSNYAPYEIFYNKYIDYEGLSRLKDIEEMLEAYYNNNRFRNSLDMMISLHYDRAVDFYEKLSVYFRQEGHFDQPLKAAYLYEILLNFYKENHGDDVEGFHSMLQYDYYLNFKKPLPIFYDGSDKGFKNRCYDLLRDKLIFNHEDLSPKQWLKRLAFVVFKKDVIKMIAGGYQPVEDGQRVIAFDYQAASGQVENYDVSEYFAQES